MSSAKADTSSPEATGLMERSASAPIVEVSHKHSHHTVQVPLHVGNQSELDSAILVMSHKPSLEIFAGSLHPSAALYEKAVDRSTAVHAHAHLHSALRKMGIHVLHVTDVLRQAPRDVLLSYALQALTYRYEGNEMELSVTERNLLSDQYKGFALQDKSVDELIDIICLQPVVVLEKARFNTPLAMRSVSLHPLSNLVFTRDQQIITAQGLVIARLNSPQREAETSVMRLVWETLGVPILGEIPFDGRLEGGDFMPISANLCMVGVGLRTNLQACYHMMRKNWLGTQYFALVKDRSDLSQDRMHLDTFFNIADCKYVLLLDSIMHDPKRHRFVDIYEIRDWNGPSSSMKFPNKCGDTGDAYGPYTLCQSDVPFVDFLHACHYAIVPVTEEQQQNYMINFVNLGKPHPKELAPPNLSPVLRAYHDDTPSPLRLDRLTASPAPHSAHRQSNHLQTNTEHQSKAKSSHATESTPLSARSDSSTSSATEALPAAIQSILHLHPAVAAPHSPVTPTTVEKPASPVFHASPSPVIVAPSPLALPGTVGEATANPYGFDSLEQKTQSHSGHHTALHEAHITPEASHNQHHSHSQSHAAHPHGNGTGHPKHGAAHSDSESKAPATATSKTGLVRSTSKEIRIDTNRVKSTTAMEAECVHANNGNRIRLLSVHPGLEQALRRAGFEGEVIYIKYEGITAMYGAAHCTTQVFRLPALAPSAGQHAMLSVPIATRHHRRASEAKKLASLFESVPKARQSTHRALMVVPTHFAMNVDASSDNQFMKPDNPFKDMARDEISKKVLAEFEQAVSVLRGVGVEVTVVVSDCQSPDAVFCNDWLSTHTSPEVACSSLVIYPMKVQNRRCERNAKVIDGIKSQYLSIWDISGYENDRQYLEGTGSMVLDRQNRIAYTALSERTHNLVVDHWAKHMNYRTVTFAAFDQHSRPIYHTNMMLSLGSTVAIVCPEAIPNENERKIVMESLQKTHDVVSISLAQIDSFCASVLEIETHHKEHSEARDLLLVMGSTAEAAYTAEQRKQLALHYRNFLVVDVKTIEAVGGGSIRSMVAEMF